MKIYEMKQQVKKNNKDDIIAKAQNYKKIDKYDS